MEATVVMVFDASDPLDREQALALVKSFPEVFPNLTLRPEDVEFSASDDLYEFNLKIRLLAEKGSLEITPQGLIMIFQEVQLVRDVELVSNIFLGVSLLLREKAERASTTVEINFHAEITSGGDRASYFSSLVTAANGIVPEGLVYYRQEAEMPIQVRYSIERSDDLPEGLFYTWKTSFDGRLTGELAGLVKTSVTGSLFALNLQFEDGTIVL